MTEVDERLLSIAKLRESVDGRIDGDDRINSVAGIVLDDDLRSSLSWVDHCYDADDRPGEFVRDEPLGQYLVETAATETATRAVKEGDASIASYLTGITEQDLDASNVTLPAQILSRLDYSGNLATILAAGAPNSGKTNTVWLLAEIAAAWWPDLMVISNAHAEIVDKRITTCHDLALTLLDHRDRPKVVVIDEGSTHFDARTNSYEVSSQWSPLLKRMAKLGVEAVAVIGHTGKDVDPEMKRLTNLALWKDEPKVAKFYETWPADDDRPADLLFGGSLEELEPTDTEYDPDEPAPWNWNLQADLFSLDLDWPELAEELASRGPAD